MTYKQAFEKLKKIVKKEKIKLILTTIKVRGVDFCIGGYTPSWDDDFQFITQNIIEIKSNYVSIMVVTLLHELGHYFHDKTKPLLQLRKYYSQKMKSCDTYNSSFGTFETIENEIIAWSKGWDVAIYLGLNKNKGFVKKFEECKKRSLGNYMAYFLKVQLKKEVK